MCQYPQLNPSQIWSNPGQIMVSPVVKFAPCPCGLPTGQIVSKLTRTPVKLGQTPAGLTRCCWMWWRTPRPASWAARTSLTCGECSPVQFTDAMPYNQTPLFYISMHCYPTDTQLSTAPGAGARATPLCAPLTFDLQPVHTFTFVKTHAHTCTRITHSTTPGARARATPMRRIMCAPRARAPTAPPSTGRAR